MSVCTFLASDHPLKTVTPPQEYPFKIDIDAGAVYDGDMDDNFFLLPFRDVQNYTDKKYGVLLEWRYTAGRAKQVITYIKSALTDTDSIELWHVWLGDHYDYEDSPVIRARTLSIDELTIEDIRKLDSAEIWDIPDKRHPNRPSFYRWTIIK